MCPLPLGKKQEKKGRRDESLQFTRTIANAIIDQAIHVDGMGRDEAMQLMIEETFQEERVGYKNTYVVQII
jgi:hypothetical protein